MLPLALLLDALLGEPPWLWRRIPHPVVLMGDLIAFLEGWLNTGTRRRAKGALTLGLCLLAVGIPAWVLQAVPYGWVFEIVGGAILLAQRSLIEHVRAVARALRQSLPDGRRTVALIVGRDPEQLDETGVARAAIESAAENFSDGVVAPAFWFLIGGLPGIALYKMINTADSMIGHRTERFSAFGWASARLDDIVNWIPARLAGGLICLVGGGRAAFDVMRSDAPLHRSPNAGWPEAALAASLGVSIAGPRVYDGTPTYDPYVNFDGRPPDADDIDAACRYLWRAWGALTGLAAFLWLIGGSWPG